MFEVNGICYGDDQTVIPEVARVKPCYGKMLLLTFSNGERKMFDTTTLNGSVFEPLKDDTVFNSVTVTDGIVNWFDGEIDIAPETIYLKSYKYETT